MRRCSRFPACIVPAHNTPRRQVHLKRASCAGGASGAGVATGAGCVVVASGAGHVVVCVVHKRVCRLLFFCSDTGSCALFVACQGQGHMQWANGRYTRCPEYGGSVVGMGGEGRGTHTSPPLRYLMEVGLGDLPHTSSRAPRRLRQIPSLKFHHGHKIKGRFAQGLHSFHTEDSNLPTAFPSKST